MDDPVLSHIDARVVVGGDGLAEIDAQLVEKEADVRDGSAHVGGKRDVCISRHTQGAAVTDQSRQLHL